VAEQDNKPAYLCGYASIQPVTPGIGGGRLYQPAGSYMLDGPAHAVRPGDREAACGKITRTTGGPWPPAGMDTPCADCQEILSRS
jgi:hypothetical protein